MKIIILSVIGIFSGDHYSYAVHVKTMEQCYEMAEIELQRKEVTEAVCNSVFVVIK
jgi:hypothetical protein